MNIQTVSENIYGKLFAIDRTNTLVSNRHSALGIQWFCALYVHVKLYVEFGIPFDMAFNYFM